MHRYGEYRWYSFGLKAGIRNLLANRASLGWKKTLGKILQPVHPYSRFPEYHFLHAAIREAIHDHQGKPPEILDVGSPKLFGFYLTSTYPIRSRLTDVREQDVQEYSTMWSALRASARGEAVIEVQDARALVYDTATFDVAYAMSALEHVEGDLGDTSAMQELWRVVKPGGLLVISVPFGDQFLLQSRVGFSYTANRVDDVGTYFFQRIYDRDALEARLLGPLGPPPESVRIHTAYRRRTMHVARAYHRALRLMGQDMSGALGFLNPLARVLLNTHAEGLARGFLSTYGPLHYVSDIYADAILECRKPNSRGGGDQG